MSLQINEELDVHSNLLEELDTQLDRTEGRLGTARKALDKVARGVKSNGPSLFVVIDFSVCDFDLREQARWLR